MVKEKVPQALLLTEAGVGSQKEEYWAKQAVAVVYPCPSTLLGDAQQLWMQ